MGKAKEGWNFLTDVVAPLFFLNCWALIWSWCFEKNQFRRKQTFYILQDRKKKLICKESMEFYLSTCLTRIIHGFPWIMTISGWILFEFQPHMSGSTLTIARFWIPKFRRWIINTQTKRFFHGRLIIKILQFVSPKGGKFSWIFRVRTAIVQGRHCRRKR